jgi:hypothetical protein
LAELCTPCGAELQPHGVGLKIRDDVCKIDEKPHRHTRQVERNRRGACPSVSSLLPSAGSGRFTLHALMAAASNLGVTADGAGGED